MNKRNNVIHACDLYDKENERQCKTVDLFIKIDPVTSGLVPVGFDFERNEFYTVDLDGNITKRMKFITLLNWEGYYDTYFAGKYIFKKSLQDED